MSFHPRSNSAAHIETRQKTRQKDFAELKLPCAIVSALVVIDFFFKKTFMIWLFSALA